MSKETNTKFKVGDKVRIKEDLNHNHDYKINVNEKMEKYRGQIMTIKSIEKNFCGDIYTLKETVREDLSIDWHWTDDMLESAISTLSDLQFGDILTTRNGERYVYTDEHIYGEDKHYHCDGDFVKINFKENLIRDSSLTEYDIMKVEREGQIIYEREDIREMTVEEISKALGYEVKVVK